MNVRTRSTKLQHINHMKKEKKATTHSFSSSTCTMHGGKVVSIIIIELKEVLHTI